MEITLLGGSSIGASCALLESAGTRILIDCGVRFDSKSPLPNLDYLSGKKLDAIVVTHGHSDHTGALPVVHSSFPGTPIFMTPPTIELVRILQKDALKLMDLAYDQEGELPLYQEQQVESMLAQSRPVHHLDFIEAGEVKISFLPAGHIIGASMLHIATPEGKVLFTGDYSVSAQKTVPALDRSPFAVDLLVTESTYGARLHSDRKFSETTMIANIREVVMEGGRVLIPCFAIGRAQEVLLIIKEAMRQNKLPKVPVFVDGMVRYICNIYASHDKYVSRAVVNAGRKGHVFYDQHIQAVTDKEQRNKVLEHSPCIIIASSGMLSGGPSSFYASQIAGNSRDAIFITGYQDEESPGNKLLSLAEDGTKEKIIELSGKTVEVACRFDKYQLSAHADRMQICGLVAGLRPKTVLLVHGDIESKQNLQSALICSDIEIGWDGLTIKRNYGKSRQTSPLRPHPITRPLIKGLIGEEPGPFPVATLAKSLYGYKLSREALSKFALEVEDTGLLKRDDNRRSIFKRISEKKESSLSKDQKNLELIKCENPKGKLYEWCQRNKLSFPEKRLALKEDGLYYCVLILSLEGKNITSEICSGKSKILAEQLACRNMYEILLRQEQKVDNVPEKNDEKEQNYSEIASPEKSEPDEKHRITSEIVADPKAKSMLNTYAQKGIIKTFHYLEPEIEGPAHNPIFTVVAEAILPDHTLVSSGKVQAHNKKEALTLAATVLLQSLQMKELSIDKKKPQTKTALTEVIVLLREYQRNFNDKLPYRYLQKLATKILKQDKLLDKEWILSQLEIMLKKWTEEKTELARQSGHYPFIQFTPESYRAINNLYGEWCLQLMAKKLINPALIFPQWAAQFAATMHQIGEKQCQSQKDLYHFITNHPTWEQNAKARSTLSETISAARVRELHRNFEN